MDYDPTLLIKHNYILRMPSKFETKEANSSKKDCEYFNQAILFKISSIENSKIIFALTNHSVLVRVFKD